MGCMELLLMEEKSKWKYLITKKGEVYRRNKKG